MADKYLNNTGLQYFYNRLKTVFANKSDFDDLSDTVESLVSEGGEPNVIETVKVNGIALTPDAQKAVNVEAAQMTYMDMVEGSEQLTLTQGSNSISFVNQNGNGVGVNGLDSGGDTVVLASQEYVQSMGGKIDHIQVNGTEQTITNKTVNITVPTKTSDLTNDSTFQTQAQVQQLIDDELANITGIEFEVVQTLPQTGVKGTIYLVHKTGTAQDIYDEYIWVEPTGQTAHYEQIGTTQVDLSDYWAISDLTAITTAEIDTIIAS